MTTTPHTHPILQRLLCLIAALMLTGMSLHADTYPSTDGEWETFMGSHDLLWDTIPKSWDMAPFMGNGELGLMIYQDTLSNMLRLETGSSRVHDHRKSRDLVGRSRLMTGHFLLISKGKIKDFHARLSLWNAETTIHMVTTVGSIDLTALVHASMMVMGIQIKCQGGEQCTLQWVPANADSPRYQYSKLPAGAWLRGSMRDYRSNPRPTVSQISDNRYVSKQRLLEGGETTVCWQQDTRGGTTTLWVSIAHSYPQSNSSAVATKAVGKAARKGYARLRRSHVAWWHSYLSKSYLSLNDKGKEKFYWLQMYKYGSATRGDRPLLDTCGPWLSVTPWPGAWWNLNVELTYWALNASNHLDIAASLEHALYDNLDSLRANLPEAYRADSYGVPRSSDLSCSGSMLGIPGISKIPEVGNLTWACHNLWLIYRHQMDDDKLRHKLFPLLQGAINYYLHFIYKGKDNYWHLPTTFSPEYGTAKDCNYDLALLKWGCQTLMWTCDRLHIKDPLYDRWKDVCHNLVPFPTDKGGLRIGSDKPFDHSHRHYSHLLCFYPLALENPVEDPAARQLLEQSIAHWFSMKDALQGYSFTGASSMSAMLGKGNDALDYLNGLFTKFLSPTTMYHESGPVIETPLSAAKCMQDMLLQSWDGKLRIFPAVPSKWTDVNFRNWLAEGAFEVSAERKGGETRRITIKSLAGEPCVVVTDMAHPRFSGSRGVRISAVAKNTYSISLKKGQHIVIENAE